MRPNERQIKAQIRKLRKAIDTQRSETSFLRIAYAMETALRWTVEDTSGWDLLNEALANAVILDASREEE